MRALTRTILVATAAAGLLAVSPSGGGADKDFAGLWEAVDRNDGALRTFSIADRDGDGVFEVAIRDTYWTLCAGDRGLHRGTGVVAPDGASMLVTGPLTCFESGQEVEVQVLLEYSRSTDTLLETPLGTPLVSNTLHRVTRR